VGATIKEEDAALLRIHVVRVRETVMDLVMVASMMDMLGAKEISSVEVTIVTSLANTTTRRMIAVRRQKLFNKSVRTELSTRGCVPQILWPYVKYK